MRCLSTGFEVALRWLWGGFVLRSLCLVYAYYMALGWLWVACRPSLFKVRGSRFNVRRSASRRNLQRRKAAFRPSAVSPAYITRAGGGWSGPLLPDHVLRIPTHGAPHGRFADLALNCLEIANSLTERQSVLKCRPVSVNVDGAGFSSMSVKKT